MTYTVIGAGMAGLLAAVMLRDECSAVLEAQPELPNNHSALLRFKTSIVGDVINVPFKEVNVMKGVVPYANNPVGDAIAYSRKTNGTATLRSVVTAEGKIEKRYIAPSDLINRMAGKVQAPILFDSPFVPFAYGQEGLAEEVWPGPKISTMPMPSLMKILEYPSAPEFRSVPGYTVNVPLKDCDVCATLYYPNPGAMRYRASITGNLLTIEYAFPGKSVEEAETAFHYLSGYPANLRDELREVYFDFGMKDAEHAAKPKIAPQPYSKILPIPEADRERFIMWATDNFGIYSLGRFATWRPGLLLDDLVKDVRTIQKIATAGAYNHKKGK